MKAVMIRIKGNQVSEGYANYCAPTWKQFDFEMYDAVTPDTLDQQRGIKAFRKDTTPTERACYYSQFNLWKRCALSRQPMIILEHDAWLSHPDAIVHNPYIDLQFLGTHAMEATLWSPSFAKHMVQWCGSNQVTGPMSDVDHQLGFFDKRNQSEVARPYTRMIGPASPVKCVLDPKHGNTIDHTKVDSRHHLYKIITLVM